jgi:hypothetical protein
MDAAHRRTPRRRRAVGSAGLALLRFFTALVHARREPTSRDRTVGPAWAVGRPEHVGSASAARGRSIESEDANEDAYHSGPQKRRAVVTVAARDLLHEPSMKTIKTLEGLGFPSVRRDGAGHLDPRAAELLARSRAGGPEAKGASAFLRAAHRYDRRAEELGEAFVAAATSGENGGDGVPGEVDMEERGGPFVETASGTEFALGTDASNPRGATREPFPRT